MSEFRSANLADALINIALAVGVVVGMIRKDMFLVNGLGFLLLYSAMPVCVKRK